jgi:hypothetical protein
MERISKSTLELIASAPGKPVGEQSTSNITRFQQCWEFCLLVRTIFKPSAGHTISWGMVKLRAHGREVRRNWY